MNYGILYTAAVNNLTALIKKFSFSFFIRIVRFRKFMHDVGL